MLKLTLKLFVYGLRILGLNMRHWYVWIMMLYASESNNNDKFYKYTEEWIKIIQKKNSLLDDFQESF